MPNDIQTDVFSKSVDYWLRRAEKSRESGQLRRAAVLFRHAARVAPEAQEACMGYANTLRELHCYESSNREAFAVLAYDAERFIPFGLIGRNMLSLGKRQEAADAFTLYMLGSQKHFGVLPDWDDEVYEMEDAYYEKNPPRRARMSGLLSIASRRLAAGDIEGAEHALKRLGNHNLGVRSTRRDMLIAALHERKGDQQTAIDEVRRCMRDTPNGCQEALNAASMLTRADKDCAARMALLRAAVNARYAIDEQMVCMAAQNLGAYDIAIAMLKRNLRREPDRLPTCYNTCVCLLRIGRFSESEGYIHLCRELDPDDVFTERLFERMKSWRAGAREALDILLEINEVPFYDQHTGGSILESSGALALALKKGVGGFAAQLSEDKVLYRNFMDALTLPNCDVGSLLPALVKALSPACAERLFREALLRMPGEGDYKRIAATELVILGAPPPYTILREGHIMSINPTVPPPKTPRLMQQLLAARLQKVNDLFHGGKIVPFGLKMLNRMTKRQRYHVAGEGGRMWPLAVCIQYSAIRDLPVMRIPELTESCKRELASALKLLQQLCAIDG